MTIYSPNCKDSKSKSQHDHSEGGCNIIFFKFQKSDSCSVERNKKDKPWKIEPLNSRPKGISRSNTHSHVQFSSILESFRIESNLEYCWGQILGWLHFLQDVQTSCLYFKALYNLPIKICSFLSFFLDLKLVFWSEKQCSFLSDHSFKAFLILHSLWLLTSLISTQNQVITLIRRPSPLKFHTSSCQ